MHRYCRKESNQCGFTLLEVVVVVAILAVAVLITGAALVGERRTEDVGVKAAALQDQLRFGMQFIEQWVRQASYAVVLCDEGYLVLDDGEGDPEPGDWLLVSISNEDEEVEQLLFYVLHEELRLLRGELLLLGDVLTGEVVDALDEPDEYYLLARDVDTSQFAVKGSTVDVLIGGGAGVNRVELTLSIFMRNWPPTE